MSSSDWLQAITDGMLLPQGSTVTCAVSGGADSMAMLWALHRLRSALHLNLRCAHFNHRLRAAADDDEAFVRAFCAEHGIAFLCGAADVAAEKLPGESLELAARRLRYAYLFSVADSGLLATAHTADDNLETMLLRLTRGASPRGMGGIPAQRGNLIRPILFSTRAQVLDFLQIEHIPFREDASNAADFCPRNRIRHHVVPLLKSENPNAAQQAYALSRTVREEDAFLSQLALEKLTETKTAEGFSTTRLLALPPVLYRRALYTILQDSGVASPEQSHYALLDSLVRSARPSAKACFPGGVTLARRYDALCLGQAAPVRIPPTRLNIPGLTRIPQAGVVIRCTFQKKAEKVQNSPTTFLLSCDMIDFASFLVRSRQEGDRLQLSGGSRSLKRLMIDKKITASRRNALPVLADQDGVIAVGGIGAAVQRCAQSGDSALQIQIENEDSSHDW